MKNSARLKAVEDIFNALEGANKPADAVISEYFKARRFIGSKDKKFIANIYYAMIRRYYEIIWLMEKTSSHNMLLAAYVLLDDLNQLSVDELFSGEPYGCAKLKKGDFSILDEMRKSISGMPERMQ